HAPSGSVENVAHLHFRADGKPTAWTRSAEDPFLFLIATPPREVLEVEFDYLPRTRSGGRLTNALSITPALAVIPMTQLIFYPDGVDLAALAADLQLILPEDWTATSILPLEGSGPRRNIASSTLADIAASPILAARHMKCWNVGTPTLPATLTLAADLPLALDAPNDRIDNYRALVRELATLFAAENDAPQRPYAFLYALSDQIHPSGVEHADGTDIRHALRTFVDPDVERAWADVPAHEMIHRWIGKRRPVAGLAQRDFHGALDTSLLWIYEGLTNYLGYVVATGAGQISQASMRDQLASLASGCQARRGRAWRSLTDTMRAAPAYFGAGPEWASDRRGADYYDEMVLVWLDIDMRLREHNGIHIGLDHVVANLFGGAASAGIAVTSDEVMDALSRAAPHIDWPEYFSRHLDDIDTPAPIAGLTRAGWRLVTKSRPNAFDRNRFAMDEELDLLGALGFSVRNDGTITDVVRDSPAANAGLVPHQRILSIGNRSFDVGTALDEMFKDGQDVRRVRLTVKDGAFVETAELCVPAGVGFPHLERGDGDDRLTVLLTPLHTA
ncbi:MAG: hypothetical protein AAF205_12445, partial [Pseudomonadota bacterium]